MGGVDFRVGFDRRACQPSGECKKCTAKQMDMPTCHKTGWRQRVTTSTAPFSLRPRKVDRQQLTFARWQMLCPDDTESGDPERDDAFNADELEAHEKVRPHSLRAPSHCLQCFASPPLAAAAARVVCGLGVRSTPKLQRGWVVA